MDRGLSGSGPWIREAYTLTGADFSLWLRLTVFYVIFAALVSQLPLAGDVLLIVLTPAIIAGAFRESAQPSAKTPTLRLRNVCFGALRDPALRLPVLSVATILLGAWVFVTVLAMVFGIDSYALGPLFAHRTLAANLFAGLLLILFWALEIGLIMTTLYVLAAIVLSALQPMEALERTLALWRDHPFVLAGPGGLMVLPLILSFYFPSWVRAVVALVTLAPLVLAVFASYTRLWPASPLQPS